MVSSTFWASLGAAALTSTVCANAVVVNQVFVNNTNAVQSYTYTQWLPGVTSMQNAVMGGSVSATLTDLNGNGATLGSQGLSAVYTALVDSAQVQHLVSGGLWFAVGQFQSGSIVPQTFGSPIPNLPVPDGTPDGQMGIQLKFTLSPGDAVSFASTFIIQPVPGPGALALLGCVGLHGLRRRRS